MPPSGSGRRHDSGAGGRRDPFPTTSDRYQRDKDRDPAQHTLPAVTILPLRLFLGLTFLYAGIQKLTDPNFLQPGHPTYIGNQLLAFSRGSPIRSILLHMMEHAVAIGLLTILTELAIGGLVLIGLLTRPAAVIGLILNFCFFLSASWHTYPYFYGSDIVFVMCWLTIALTGPGPFSLDELLQGRLWEGFEYVTGVRPSWLTRATLMGQAHQRIPSQGSAPVLERNTDGPLLTRAEALIAGVGAIVLVVLGLVPRGGSTGQASGTLSGGATAPGAGASPTPNAGTSATPTPSRSGSAVSLPAGAKKIGNVSQLPVNTAGTVSDPATGDPVVIIHLTGSQFYAYDAVCTHAGCTVQYDPQQKLLVCPCHGGTFDPAHGAEVVAGPPPSPLNPIEMKIDSQGNIYIV